MQNDLFTGMQHFCFIELCMRMEAESFNPKEKQRKIRITLLRDCPFLMWMFKSLECRTVFLRTTWHKFHEEFRSTLLLPGQILQAFKKIVSQMPKPESIQVMEVAFDIRTHASYSSPGN